MDNGGLGSGEDEAQGLYGRQLDHRPELEIGLLQLGLGLVKNLIQFEELVEVVQA